MRAFGGTDSTRFDGQIEARESWKANLTTTPSVPGRNPSRVHVCPECGGVNLIEDFDQGETICQDCGLVLSQNLMSRGPEWRAFTKGDRMRGAGWAYLLHFLFTIKVSPRS